MEDAKKRMDGITAQLNANNKYLLLSKEPPFEKNSPIFIGGNADPDLLYELLCQFFSSGPGIRAVAKSAYEATIGNTAGSSSDRGEYHGGGSFKKKRDVLMKKIQATLREELGENVEMNLIDLKTGEGLAQFIDLINSFIKENAPAPDPESEKGNGPAVPVAEACSDGAPKLD